MSDLERQTLYDKIWQETEFLCREHKSPAPFENVLNQFDLNLVTGHRARLGPLSDFTEPFVSKLTRIMKEVFAVSMNLRLIPAGKLHLTIFPLYLDKPNEFFDRGDPIKRQQDYSRVREIVRKHGPVNLEMEDILLTPEGTLVACGFDKKETIDRLRVDLEQSLPDAARIIPKLIHITLGRYKERPLAEEFAAAQNWVTQNRHRIIGPVRITNPILVATCDREGLIPHKEAEAELDRFHF